MRIIVLLKRGADREAFIRDLEATGLKWKATGLPRHFIVRCKSFASFPLFDHPSIDKVESGETRAKMAARQTLDIDVNIDGDNWGLARVIRRDTPWNKNWLRFPMAVPTFFECVRDGTGVDIYILDSGVRTTHDEVSGRVTQIDGGTPAPGTDHYHGTACAALLIGSSVGIARGATLFASRCIDGAGVGTTADFIESAGYVLTHFTDRAGLNRPAVCSMSLIYPTTTIGDAVDDLMDAGIVCVACAGNDKRDLNDITSYPSEVTDVICVGGVGMDDTPYYKGTDGSNWGTRIDVSAPAMKLWTATNTADDAYTTFRGTSGACPLVAGSIACMLQGHDRLTTRAEVQAVRTHVRGVASTGKINNNNDYGITLPDRLFYLDPVQTAPETISGL